MRDNTGLPVTPCTHTVHNKHKSAAWSHLAKSEFSAIEGRARDCHWGDSSGTLSRASGDESHPAFTHASEIASRKTAMSLRRFHILLRLILPDFDMKRFAAMLPLLRAAKYVTLIQEEEI
jgi:hypothetical protein